jgi:DNA-binding NarL/FixJ family response regulator
MKLLLIDRSGFQLQTRKMLLEEAMNGIVDIASTLGEVFIAYQKEKYDVVVIDHGIENGQQCIDHILQLSPNQSILVVSDAIHCVISRCEDCVKNHYIRRLFNPTPIKNIVRMVEGFKGYACDHYDAETNRIKG